MSLIRIPLIGLIVLALAPAALAQEAAPVEVAPAEKRPITVANRLVATVEPMMRSTVAAEQAALVRERYFDEGQQVEAGALLARFDDSLLQRRLASAEAALRSAQAELERARLNEENFRRERDRLTGLYEQGVATEKEYFDAVNEHQRSEAAVTVETARVAEREAATEELKLEIQKTRVVAPFSGVINRRYVEVGQWVRQGDPVAEIVQLDPLYVRTGVPEAVLSRIKAGDKAHISIDALGGREIEATVAEILPVADAESRTFPVRLRVENPEHQLLPGMFARATFSQQDDSWLVVSKDALLRVRGQPMLVVADNGQARTVPVTLGAADDQLQAVRGEGLREGDQVIIRGNEGLRDGMPVQVLGPPGGGPPGGGFGGGPPGAGGPPQGGGEAREGGQSPAPATRPASGD